MSVWWLVVMFIVGFVVGWKARLVWAVKMMNQFRERYYQTMADRQRQDPEYLQRLARQHPSAMLRRAGGEVTCSWCKKTWDDDGTEPPECTMEPATMREVRERS